MPLRRSQVYALDVISYNGQTATLSLHVESGTYVRSIATALGGHCRTLRRTAVGPFRIEEATPPDQPALLPIRDVLDRLPADAVDRVAAGVIAGVLALADEGPGAAA
jgi:tRNA U55 pseudouridine synthase TruB